jgi:carbon-monoxide dehydrogenase small subunit
MSEHRNIRSTINGRIYELSVPPNETLLDLLRYRLGLVGTKNGCETGDCGACTVIMDGRAVSSCLVLAIEINRASVTTIEGLAANGEMHPLQQAFVDQGVVQCGFCIPGMIISAKALLDEEPDPSEEDIRSAIAGNLCRCTGYGSILSAIAAAGKSLRGGGAK